MMSAALPEDHAPRPLPLRGDGWPWILAYLILAVPAAGLWLPGMVRGGANLYLAQPIVWLGLGWLCRLLQGPALVARRDLLVLALLGGLFHVALFALAGLVFGFGRSPYAAGPPAVLANLIYLACLLWGVETARAFLLRAWAGAGGLAFLGVALILTFTALPLARAGLLLEDGEQRFLFVGEALLPALAESAAATLLALVGGPWAAIAYRGVIAVTEWASPFLPDLPWTLRALLGVLAPGAVFLSVSAVTAPRTADTPAPGLSGWLVAASTGALLVLWLNSGLLGVQPALVSGVSMEPSLHHGDVVLTRRVPPETLRPGDVIRFRSGQVPVLHRIVQVRRGGDGALVFTTRGDANPYPDPPVPAAAVEGKVVFAVPRIGLLPIALRNLFTTR